MAKDKNEVAEIIKNRKPSSQFQDFLELCNVVKKRLSKNSSIINGIVFKAYSGKNVTISWEGNQTEIDKALANDYIDDDLVVKWEETTEMIKIKEALDKVSDFISKDLKEDFYQSYNEFFDMPMSISNKKFWEYAFEASISFS